jgi:hypothetical protein
MKKITEIIFLFTFFAGATLVGRCATTDASLDQLLTSVAQVVKERAKRVAIQTIQDRLVSNLCDGRNLTLTAGSSGTQSVIQIGCGSPNCHGNEVYFKRSCNLLKQEGASLSDQYLLRTLGQDLISFLFRLSFYDVSNEQYELLKIPEVSEFAYSSIETIANGGSIDDLANPMLELADGVDGQAGLKLLQMVSDNPAQQKNADIVNQLHDLATALSASGVEISDWKNRKDVLFPRDPNSWYEGGGKSLALTVYHEAVGSTSSAKSIDALCGTDVCRLGRLLSVLLPPIQKLRTNKSQKDEFRDSTVRNLFYLLPEMPTYYQDIKILGSKTKGVFDATTLTAQLKDWESDIRQSMDDSGASRLDLGLFFKVVGSQLRAHQVASEGTQAWLQKLSGNIENLPETGDPVAALLSSDSFRSGVKIDPLVVPLRDAIKNLLSLSSLRESKSKGGFLAIEVFLKELPRLDGPSDLSPTPAAMADHLADLMGAFGQVLAVSGDSELVREQAETSSILKYVGRKDWVSLAFEASEKLRAHSDTKGVDMRIFTFMRTLMGMYQAKSVEEAKSILVADLEDVSSRQQRYHDFSIDVAAIVGGNYGKQDGVGDQLTVSGVFAPVGFQIAWGWLGVLIYPVDIGGYLTSTQDQTFKVSQAIRPGGALYLRPWSTIPIIAGEAFDYQPGSINSSANSRAETFLSLELPLIAIH